MLLPTSDALWNIRSEFAAGEGEMAFCMVGLLYFYPQKIPLLSPTTFPCEVDGLFALLDEESSLPVVHVSRRELGGKPRAHPEFGSCTYSSSGCALVAACWKQRGQGAVSGQSPGALLASRPGLLPTSKPWLNLGQASGKAIIYLLWINNLNYWSPVGQIFLCWLHYSPLICFPLS